MLFWLCVIVLKKITAPANALVVVKFSKEKHNKKHEISKLVSYAFSHPPSRDPCIEDL